MQEHWFFKERGIINFNIYAKGHIDRNWNRKKIFLRSEYWEIPGTRLLFYFTFHFTVQVILAVCSFRCVVVKICIRDLLSVWRHNYASYFCYPIIIRRPVVHKKRSVKAFSHFKRCCKSCWLFITSRHTRDMLSIWLYVCTIFNHTAEISNS